MSLRKQAGITFKFWLVLFLLISIVWLVDYRNQQSTITQLQQHRHQLRQERALEEVYLRAARFKLESEEFRLITAGLDDEQWAALIHRIEEE